jgi:hypothetical protein
MGPDQGRLPGGQARRRLWKLAWQEEMGCRQRAAREGTRKIVIWGDETVRAVFVEQELRGRSDHVGIAHQREPAVVQNQPLSVHARRSHRMVFVRKEVSQDDDLHISTGQSRLAQRDILDDHIVLAVAAMRL